MSKDTRVLVGQGQKLHCMWVATSTVNLVPSIILNHHTFGTPVTLCGMVCNVNEMRDLVATILDCPGLTRTHPQTPLPQSTYVSVSMRTQAMKILVLNVWNSLSNN